MAAFEDLKERLSSEAKNQWDKFQDSSLFIQTKERYENLTPVMQKVTLGAVAVILLYLVLAVPLGFFSSSSESVAAFDDKRQLIRDMLKVSREAQEAPDLPVPPDLGTLRTQIDAQLHAARLLPEQIKGTDNSSEPVKLIPGNLSQGALTVSLAQLNLRQIVDLGHALQSLSPSIKMTDLKMEANARDARYFDVVYKLVMLAVPNQTNELETPEAPPPPKKRGK